MSGICGICVADPSVGQQNMRSMLGRLVLNSNEDQQSMYRNGATFAVAKTFAGQDIACASGLLAVVDSDLLNVDVLRALVQSEGLPAPTGVAGLFASLYRLYGVDFVHKLDGAFACAIFDEDARRLVLAIDRVGIKNIYWSFAKGCFAFATRVGALREISPLELDEAALAQYLLFSAVPAPLSIYKGVEKMRPGFLLIAENGQIRHKQYWDVEYHEEHRPEREWAEILRAELRASVHRHMRRIEPEATGAFLSGGTDSSSVVAFMSERKRPVRTFSAIFKESSYSEEDYVRIIAERFATEQHDCCLSPQDAIAAIPRISAYYDEPFANSSAIAAYFCSLTAQQCGVDLLLGGDGGDELFAGNERYESDKRFALYQRVPRFLRRSVIEPAISLLPMDHKWLGLPRRYVRRASIPNPQRSFSYNFFLSFPLHEIFVDEFLQRAPAKDWLDIPQSHFARCSDAVELNRVLYMDLKMVLADNDLKKVSGMAELAGIQVRYPLLDYRLVGLAARIPASLKLRRFEKRYVFKSAMSGILPDAVLYKKKHGMGVPISAWLLNDPQLHAFAQDVLHDSRTQQRGYFRSGFVDRLLELRSDHIGYYGEIVWYLVALELWHREHFDRSERFACVV